MLYFYNIFANIMLPIFMVILTGLALKKKFNIDIKTLIRIQFYLLTPIVLFLKVYDSKLNGDMVFKVTVIVMLVLSTVFLVSLIISKLMGDSKIQTSSFTNSSTFFNAGNFSLPLMSLVFDNPLALAIQAIILLLTNSLFFSFGIYNVKNGKRRAKDALLMVLKMPLIYVIVGAIILKRLDIKLWSPVWESLNILSGAFVPLSLIILGAQLSNTKFRINNIRLYISIIIRLIVSPLICYIIVCILGIKGLLAQVLIISMGAPTAVNVVLAAIENDCESDFTSQVVLGTTLLSAFTLTFIIYLVLNFI